MPKPPLPKPQSAILAPASCHALFMTLMIKPGGEPSVRQLLAQQQSLCDALAAQSSTAIHCASGIASSAWDRLWPQQRPAQLRPFRERLSLDGQRHAPATPADWFIHIHSERADLNYQLGRQLLDAVADEVEVVEEVAGFRYLDSRDMIGFVDGTENPQGEERATVALVGEEDALFEAGSYVSIQRYVHRLRDWDQLALAEQEAVVGRTRADDVELDEQSKPPTAHIARVVIEEEGEELEILRHSMPWGTPSQSGLYFVAYGRKPDHFDRMLDRMIGPQAHGAGGHAEDGDGLHDHLLEHTQALTGAAFFVPSQAFLQDL